MPGYRCVADHYNACMVLILSTRNQECSQAEPKCWMCPARAMKRLKRNTLIEHSNTLLKQLIALIVPC